MKIGLLMSIYDGMDYLEECLTPWIDYRKDGNHFLVIALVHNCFKENFENGEPLCSKDGTIEYLQKLKTKNQIDFFEVLEQPSFEHEARNIPLNYLLKEKVDYIITSAPDEIFTYEQIEKIFEFVRKNPFAAWFTINYKNYTFSKTTYTLGFSPPRIFMVQLRNAYLKSFFWDDDVKWITDDNLEISYKALASIEIPKNVALIKHYTWLNNVKSKQKCAYQNSHFGPPRGFGCGFRWNETENKLEFNPDYYQKANQRPPELFCD